MKAMGLCVMIGLLMTMLMSGCGDVPHGVSAPTTTTTTTTTVTTTTTTLPQSGGLDTLSFTGRVLEVDAEAVLMECVGACALGDRAWVQLGRFPDLKPQVGETYKVTYEDMVMLSLPPRVVAVAIEPAVSES